MGTNNVNTNTTTNNAGFPPVPPETRQQAGVVKQKKLWLFEGFAMRKNSTSFGSLVNAVNTVETVMRGLRPLHGAAVEVGAALVFSALFLAFFI